MSFWNMFRQPYLNEDDGFDLGGGGTPTDTAGQQTDTGVAGTTGGEGTQQAQQGTQQQAPQTFKVKFNHKELELPYEEAVQHIQKGMNYDKAIERARQEALQGNPVLSYLTEKAQKLGLTVEQLIENDRKFEEQEALNRLIQQNIPEEYAKKLLEHDKFMQEYQTEKQMREQKEKEQKMYSDFLEAYPDVKPEDIPVEVWQEVKAGRDLTDAYARYENKRLKEEMAKYQTQQQTQQANEKNAAASAGSAKSTEKSQTQDPFLAGFDSVK